MKLRALLALSLLLSAPAHAQIPGSSRRTQFAAYDVASASAIYGIYGLPVQSPKPLKTTGSSTTVSEVAAADNPFAGFVIGDLITVVRPNGLVEQRRVTSVAGIPDNVVVDTAVNWDLAAGFQFSYQRFTVGTGANIGWWPVGNCDEKDLVITVTTFAATSITFTVQGRQLGAYGAITTTIYTRTFVAAGNEPVPVVEHMDDLRVGVEVAGDVGVQSVSATFLCRVAR